MTTCILPTRGGSRSKNIRYQIALTLPPSLDCWHYPSERERPARCYHTSERASVYLGRQRWAEWLNDKRTYDVCVHMYTHYAHNCK